MRIFLRSMLMVSGMVRMILYPLAAAMDARPIPVFPDVGSMMTESGFRRPWASAASIIPLAILSLTLPAGLKSSSLTTSLALRPYFFSSLVSSRRGVCPTSSVTFVCIGISDDSL